MLRIIHLTRDFPPRGSGGISTAVHGLCTALGRAGIHSEVVSFDDWRPRRGARPTKPEIQEPGVWRIRCPQELDALRARLFALSAAIVHVHDPLLGALGVELSTHLGAKLVYTAHVLHRHQDRLRNLKQATRSAIAEEAIVRGADVVTAPSMLAASLVEELHGRTCSVTRLGVPGPTDSSAAREPNLVVYVGRFGDVKGTMDFARAASRMPAGVAKFSVVGGLIHNSKADRRWRRRLQTEAARAELMFEGWKTEAGQWYERAAVVVVPSRFETFGLVTAEAMGHGAAVVATRTGAHAELIGDAGILVYAGDVDAIVASTCSLLSEPTRANAIRANAPRAMLQWSWPRTVGDWIAVYAQPRGSSTTSNLRRPSPS